MKPVTVDDKGRIVLPQELREQYGITRGAMLWFVPTQSGIEIRRAAPPAAGLGRIGRAVIAEYEAGKTRALSDVVAEMNIHPARLRRTMSNSPRRRKRTSPHTPRARR